MAHASTVRKHCCFISFFQTIKNLFLPHLLVTQSLFSPELSCSQNLYYTITSFVLLLLSNYYPPSSYWYFPPLIFIARYLFILPITLPELWFRLLCLSRVVFVSCLCLCFRSIYFCNGLRFNVSLGQKRAYKRGLLLHHLLMS